jgi:hypothetical protein
VAISGGRVSKLLESGAGLVFRNYGGQTDHVREEAERFRVMEQVVLHGSVSQDEALAAIKGAGLAVVITTVAEEATLAEKGIMTGKVFEPLGLGTPILLIAPPGSDVEAIAETTGLAQQFTGSDVAGMASFLTGLISGRAIAPKSVEAYAWSSLAGRFDAILREAAIGVRCD